MTALFSNRLVLITLASVLTAWTTLARCESATVIKSIPVYSPDSYYLQCHNSLANGQPVCEKIARPDRPFPLPISFMTTIRLEDGSIEQVESENRYDPGVRVEIKRVP